MARILVTGASGFIGAHVARRLAADGHQVLATGRDAARLAELGPTVGQFTADLASDDVSPWLHGCDVIVHCAAMSSPWGRPQDFWQANVVATERVIAAAKAHAVRRLIHLGSPSIYFRFQDQYQVGEDFVPPRRWITDYARTKWASECRVRAAADASLETLILRPRAVFGEGDRAILPRVLAVAASGRFPLVNAGRALIDLTHVDNLTALVSHCTQADLYYNGRAYNVSNGTPVRVRSMLESLFAELGRPVRMIPLPRVPMVALAGLAEAVAKLKAGRPEPRLTRYGIGVIGYSQTLDITRARQELDYQPAVSIQAGLSRYAHWWKTHGHA